MRIVVNDIAACDGGGSLTVLHNFYDAVLEYGKDHHWIFLLSDMYLEPKENIEIACYKGVKKNRINRLLFDMVYAGREISKYKPDVFFSLQNNITGGVRVKQVVYIQQSLPFQSIRSFSLFKRDEFYIALRQKVIGRLIRLSARKADKVIVQTQWMKRAVCEKTKISENKVSVIPTTIRNIPTITSPDEFDSRMFFYPTDDYPYKNIGLIIDACQYLQAEDYSIYLTVRTHTANERIHCVGTISYEEVFRFYRKATLLFPSYIESFGLPLAEARIMGSIILAADMPFAHEQLDDYCNAYFFNPDDPTELARLMDRVISGEIRRKQDNTCTGEDSWQQMIREITKVRP